MGMDWWTDNNMYGNLNPKEINLECRLTGPIEIKNLTIMDEIFKMLKDKFSNVKIIEDAQHDPNGIMKLYVNYKSFEWILDTLEAQS